jgi:hypothetical protein
MPNHLQPTGILARISFYHEQGALIEVISQRSRINEIGINPERYDESLFIKIGTRITLYDKHYEVIDTFLKFMPRLNSSTVPEIDPYTYFTDENEQLPNNLFVHVILRPIN